ncbi:MAG: hypothetical protein HQ502_20040 [Alphaproteobacteria bacterium]|nr:hypothetical protein [Alphaproteobacteria bacterium]
MSERHSADLKIRRGGPEGPAQFEHFEFEFEDGQSVLDALRWIRGNRDASLAVRYSCINANACKECMMRIEGRTQYACTARLGTGGATIEPLHNKRLIRDLVTDIVPPKEKLGMLR